MLNNSTSTTKWVITFFTISLVTWALVGCSDDAPLTPLAGDNDPTTDVVKANFDSNQGEFTILGSFNDPVVGQFAIYGRNIRYDGEVGGLVVDLSVKNLGDETYHEPVTMTFLSLLPEGVTVLNPDNEINGPGAAIVFEFENDDDMWTPEEESLPRETHFGVEGGVSIGFVARLDVGEEGNLGSIGGMVWNDENGDGNMDENEEGLEGATLVLDAEGMEPETTTSGSDGLYQFDELEAGFYTVSKVRDEECELTTARTIYILLVNENGDVDSFLAANFGCREEIVSGTAIIKGRVFNDLNGNGSQDDEEPGLEGVVIELSGDASGRETSGPEGGYAFTELTAGDYVVECAGLEGWVPTTEPELRITLETNDQVYNEASFGWQEEVTSGTAVIKGRVFNDLNGNGSQDDEEPGLEGITIELSGDGTGSQTSGPEGGYAFTELTAGDYVVACDGPEGWISTTEPELRITLETNDQVYNEASFGWQEEVTSASLTSAGSTRARSD